MHDNLDYLLSTAERNICCCLPYTSLVYTLYSHTIRALSIYVNVNVFRNNVTLNSYTPDIKPKQSSNLKEVI